MRQDFKKVDPAFDVNGLQHFTPVLEQSKWQREMGLPHGFNPPGVCFVHNPLDRMLCEQKVAHAG